jgi:DNA-binding transcriptional regulator LsrR (DeoR family)
MPKAASNDELRLLVKVSRFYYEDDLNQDAITERLGLSRSKVSRLMAQAREMGIVQISVVPPEQLFTDLEAQLEERYALLEALVVEAPPTEAQGAVSRVIGTAAAGYLARAIGTRSTVGFAWGSTLYHLAAALPPYRLPDVQIVQIIGGLGPPDSELHATELCRHLSRALGCRMALLPVPGIVADQRTREALLLDVHVQRAVQAFDHLDIAFVGVGAPTPDSVVMRDGSIITQSELDDLLRRGVVGDIALRFFDAEGRYVESEISDRIIGMTLDQLKRTPRVVGVSGGPDKAEALRAALAGGLINVLITDSATAERLLEVPPGGKIAAAPRPAARREAAATHSTVNGHG